MKNSNDTIGNRTRDLLVSSAVPRKQLHVTLHNRELKATFIIFVWGMYELDECERDCAIQLVRAHYSFKEKSEQISTKFIIVVLL